MEVYIEYYKSGEKGHLLPPGGINEDLWGAMIHKLSLKVWLGIVGESGGSYSRLKKTTYAKEGAI